MEARIVGTTQRYLHTLLIGALFCASFAVMAVVEVARAPEVYGCTSCPSQPPAATDDGFLSKVRSDVNELNSYSESNPVPCSGQWPNVKIGDDGGGGPQSGILRWREPALGQDGWRGDQDNGEPGHYWRLECYGTGDTEYGELVRVQFFQVTPVNLARLAVAEALARAAWPEVHMSPEPAEQLVNFTTFLWVEGIATEGVQTSISVPGMSVQVTASTSGVYWNMGNGETKSCAGNGQPVGSCSYVYPSSSANQGDLQFHGSASVRWTAVYYVNGAGPFTVDDAIVRSTPFSVRVAEGQAIVTGSR